jgi:hypothetical protein
MPAASKISHTVDGATVTPSFVSSPWILRCAYAGQARQRSEPSPVSRLIPHTAGLPPQDRVLVPEHQQFSILRQVTAAHQDGQAEHPTRKAST